MVKPRIRRTLSIRAAIERWPDCWECAGWSETGWIVAHSPTVKGAYEMFQYKIIKRMKERALGQAP